MNKTQTDKGYSLTLPSDREIKMTRIFNAPRELVWKVWTDPALIPQWWGPKKYPTVVEKMDVRVGGAWRYISRGENGEEFAFRGEYKEIVPVERIACTFEFEPMAGHISLDTATFEELPDGRTLMTSTALFSSQEDRDGMMQSGMEDGATETYDRFDELVQSMK